MTENALLTLPYTRIIYESNYKITSAGEEIL